MSKDHIRLAHAAWKRIVKPGDTVIDATCGNGHDTLCLAGLALTEDAGNLYAIDIQEDAIKKTQERVSRHLSISQLDRIVFSLNGHQQFPPLAAQSVKLIVYNLGYLPGGNKNLTTRVGTTLASLSDALNLVMPGGAISVTCYPGHPEGKVEGKAVIHFMECLSSNEWIHFGIYVKNKVDSPFVCLCCRS
jgi:predicted methyltransferase